MNLSCNLSCNPFMIGDSYWDEKILKIFKIENQRELNDLGENMLQKGLQKRKSQSSETTETFRVGVWRHNAECIWVVDLNPET